MIRTDEFSTGGGADILIEEQGPGEVHRPEPDHTFEVAPEWPLQLDPLGEQPAVRCARDPGEEEDEDEDLDFFSDEDEEEDELEDEDEFEDEFDEEEEEEEEDEAEDEEL